MLFVITINIEGIRSMQNYIESNKKNWNERVDIHEKSQYYDIDGFVNGNSTLKGIELNEIGDFKDKKILHLQCHFGLDTLSMAREGAIVLGVDLSDKAIDLAKRLVKNQELKLGLSVLIYLSLTSY